MGKINQGILGGFSGKVGNVIGGNWKGIDYMRVKPASVANPKTEGQVDQRSKFSTVLRFLQPMKDFVKVGYKGYAVKMTEFNSAMSYILKNGVTGTYPDFTIDYANALVSRGSLSGAMNASAESLHKGIVNFEWDDNSTEGSASETDKAMLLVVNQGKGEVIFTTAGSARSAEGQVLPVPDEYSGDEVQCFLAFISEDGTLVANSKFLGTVTVSSDEPNP